jgi:hypothetical protein
MQLNIDVSNATDEELEQIKNAVIKRLVERAQNPSLRIADYDRHGSGHSRSGTGSTLREDLTNPAGVVGQVAPKAK